MAPTATPTPGDLLLSPTDHTLVMIDFQSQMSFATKSIDATLLRNNAALVANAAAGFKVSTILTTVAEKSFSGPMFEEITDAFPGQALLDRTSMNTWEDAAVIDEITPHRQVAHRAERVVDQRVHRRTGGSRPCRRASRSMSSPMPAATSPTRRMSARWSAWCRRAHAR